MSGKEPSRPVARAFEQTTLRIAISDILPLREVGESIKQSVKFGQIAASIKEVGIIEPPVVYRDKDNANQFHLLDGHIRLSVMKKMGANEVVCLVATEDEAFTYNKHISRLASIQEHKMILKAIEKGVPEERLARALNVNINSIRMKRDLLVGICAEAAELLRDKHVPMKTFVELKRLKAMRQIEAAQLMIAMNKYSVTYAKSLVAASLPEQLLKRSSKKAGVLSEAQIALMQQESSELDREFRVIEQSYAADHLNLVLAMAYVSKLLESARIVKYLAQFYPDILSEFQSIADLRNAS